MKIFIQGHQIRIPLQEIVHAMTGEAIQFTKYPGEADVISVHEPLPEGSNITTTIRIGVKTYSHSLLHHPLRGRNHKQSMLDGVKICYYLLARKVYGKELPWGCITGIRPAKIAADYLYEGGKDDFKRDYLLSEEKADLAVRVARSQMQLEQQIDRGAVGIYMGIPFCPTRCLYCSFVSLPMDKQKRNIQPYVDALCQEIEFTGKGLRAQGRSLGPVYMGGGTPTSLTAEQLEQILSAAETYLFDKPPAEFTVEAGRPDTITEEKLITLMRHGVTRISINPQTLNDSVLASIGRKHTAQEFLDAFSLARACGFRHINTDLIAGLPGENRDMFLNSLQQLIGLAPEAITVHTMCVKRAADLKRTAAPESYSPSSMVWRAETLLQKNGYHPYYMYRQKDTLDNLENTGYAKTGYESVYNVFMMEDLGSVLGLGAGSVSKLFCLKTGQIERVFNLKDAHEYIRNFEEILRRKGEALTLLQKFEEDNQK